MEGGHSRPILPRAVPSLASSAANERPRACTARSCLSTLDRPGSPIHTHSKSLTLLQGTPSDSAEHSICSASEAFCYRRRTATAPPRALFLLPPDALTSSRPALGPQLFNLCILGPVTRVHLDGNEWNTNVAHELETTAKGPGRPSYLGNKPNLPPAYSRPPDGLADVTFQHPPQTIQSARVVGRSGVRTTHFPALLRHAWSPTLQPVARSCYARCNLLRKIDVCGAVAEGVHAKSKLR